MFEEFKNQQKYFEWRIKKIKRIEKKFPEIFFVKNKYCLDIGCGAEAPLSFYLSKKGAIVFGGDINKKIINSAKKFAKKARLKVFASEKIPFKNEKFDFIYLLDVLEHVKSPYLALKEAKRVTKKKGFIFVEFSPYWAYPSGHHLYTLGLKGLIPFQILPLKITKKIVMTSKTGTKDSPKYLFDQFKNLNKLSIRKFEKIANKLGLEKLKEKYCIVLPNKEIEINFIKNIPVIKELISMSYACMLKKTNK